MNNAIPKWLEIEIVSGIQKLVALRLINTPANDMITATASVWFDALSVAGIDWDEQKDQARVRTGFQLLCLKVTHWPAPSQLISALPQREQTQLVLAQDFSAEDKKRNRLKIKTLINQLVSTKRSI